MKFIEVKSLSKDYGEKTTLVHALKNIDFSIEKGELVVIIGSSGAGKTTLLNILGGMDTLTSGHYFIDGKDLATADIRFLEDFRREDIGFVFQFYNLIANLTAYENVALASSIVSHPLDSLDIITKVGLKDRRGNFPYQLSGGEQQRISIARAIVKNPKLLLCDEPTGALDSKTGRNIIKLLFSLCRQYKTTVIIVTHNSSLCNIADHVIKIEDGQVVEDIIQEKKESIEDLDY